MMSHLCFMTKVTEFGIVVTLSNFSIRLLYTFMSKLTGTEKIVKFATVSILQRQQNNFNA